MITIVAIMKVIAMLMVVQVLSTFDNSYGEGNDRESRNGNSNGHRNCNDY